MPVVVGESDIYIQFPSETSERKLHVLVTKSWTHDTIIIGIHTLGEWGSIKASFLLPGPGKTEVVAITEGKKSTFKKSVHRT